MNQQRWETGQWLGGRPSDSSYDQRDLSRARLGFVRRPAPVFCVRSTPLGEGKPRITNNNRILDESSGSAINIVYKSIAVVNSCYSEGASTSPHLISVSDCSSS